MVYLLLFFAISKAETTTLPSVDIIETTTAFKTTSLYLLGIDKSESPNLLMYSFVHPNGGIQTETGRVMAGEKGAINLKAFGAISLGGNSDNPKHNLKWVRNKRSDNGYYLADEFGDQKIGSNEEIISFKAFDGMFRKLSPS